MTPWRINRNNLKQRRKAAGNPGQTKIEGNQSRSLLRRLFSLAVILCCMLPGLSPAFSASDEPVNQLWVTDLSGTDESASQDQIPIDAIRWFYSREMNSYCLCLPSYVSASAIRVWFEGPKSVVLGGVTLRSGDTTDLLKPGSVLLLEHGGRKSRLSVLQSANLAAVFLSTQSGSLSYISESKNNRESGRLLVVRKDGVTEYDEELDYVRVRGNNSFYAEKKSLQLRLKSPFDMLNMGESRTWLLLANHADQSLLRNAVSLDLAAAAGLPYACQYRFADVYMNNRYMGSYLISEKVETGPNRTEINDLEKETESVNTAPLSSYPSFGTRSYAKNTKKGVVIPNDPADITGGYLMQLELEDRYASEASGFVTSRGQAIIVTCPKYASAAQVDYISALVQSFENAISASDGVDPDTGRHYTQIADLPSMARRYVLEEIAKNIDANKSSAYLYKDSDSIDSLLYFGMPWDYDRAYGNYSNKYLKETMEASGFFVNCHREKSYYWYPKLYGQADFYESGVKTGATYEANIRYLYDFLEERTAFLCGEWADEAR